MIEQLRVPGRSDSPIVGAAGIRDRVQEQGRIAFTARGLDVSMVADEPDRETLRRPIAEARREPSCCMNCQATAASIPIEIEGSIAAASD